MGRKKSLQKVAREEMDAEVIKRRVEELKRLLNREEELQEQIKEVRKMIVETEEGKRDVKDAQEKPYPYIATTGLRQVLRGY